MWKEDGVLSVGISLRIAVWLTKSFWHDLFAIKAGLLDHSFWELLTSGPDFEQSAPLGFLLAGKTLGICACWNNLALEFPILLAGIATLFLFRRLLYALHIEHVRSLFLTIAAIHPSLIWYSTDFKPYGLDALFATCFALLLVSGPSRKTLVRLTILSAVAPLFSTASLFLVVVTFVCLFAMRVWMERGSGHLTYWDAWRAIREFSPAIASAALFGGIALWHVTATMPTEVMDFHWSHGFAPLPFTKNGLFWHWIHFARLFKAPIYFLHLPFIPSPQQVLAVLLNVFLIFVGFLCPTMKRARWMAVSAVLLWFSCLVASHFGKWSIIVGFPCPARLLCFLIPSFTCAIALGVERVCRWASEKYRRPVLCLLFFLSVFSILPQLDKEVVRHYRGGRLDYEADNRNLTPLVEALGPSDLVVSESWAPDCFVHSIPHNPKSRIMLYANEIPTCPEDGSLFLVLNRKGTRKDETPESLRGLTLAAYPSPTFEHEEIEGNWFSIIRICRKKRLE